VRPAALSLVVFLAAPLAYAQEVVPGQGAIVVRNTEHEGKAPVYTSDSGGAVEAVAERGDFVAGWTSTGIISHIYQFQTSNGRVHVVFLPNKKPGFIKTGWMDPADLQPFDYDCKCGFEAYHGIQLEACSPFAPVNIIKVRWNACFEAARDAALSAPAADPAPAAAAAPADQPLSADAIAALTSDPAPMPKPATHSNGASKTKKNLTNADVIALVKAGLSDAVVIDKIRLYSGEHLDTSPEALIRLKKSGVSSAVIDAIVKRQGET